MKDQIVSILKHTTDLSAEELIHLLETPPNREQGDIALPCFQLAKKMRQAPNQIAAQLAERINQESLSPVGLAKVQNIGSYLNFYFDRQEIGRQWLSTPLEHVLENNQSGANQTVVIEYSSPNIAKHFKLYHIRTTMIGQALANTYEALGYRVERMNHVGDWGTQFGKLIAAYLKWGNEQKVKENPIQELVSLYVQFHEEEEKDPRLEEEGRLWFKKLETGDPEAVRLWEWFKQESLKEFDKIYTLLDVSFDHYLGESFYSDQMDGIIEELKEKNLLEESDGALVVRLDEQNIAPCIIQKSDGASIYATRDIAAALYREKRFHPHKILYVVDQRQSLHFQQVFSVLKKMGYSFADGCQHLSFGVMKIEGEIGSTRKGKGLLLEEVLDHAILKAKSMIDEKNPTLENKEEVAKAIGIGAIVFNDLKQFRTHDVDFHWDEAFNFEGKTGPYVQYTHARICSLLRRNQQESIEVIKHPLFEQETPWHLLFAIQEYPMVLKETVDKNDPSQIARYLLEICQLFNRFYAHERIFVDNKEEQQAKLALCQKTGEILRHGLAMLNIKAPVEI